MTAPPGMACGDVLTIFDYEHEDGETLSGSKYFVVMGYFDDHVYGFLTTSQEKGGRVKKEGCHVSFNAYPSNFYIKFKSGALSPATWVLLRMETIPLKSLQERLAQGSAFRNFTLDVNHVRALKNCFERSLEWAPFYAQFICC